MHLSILFVFNGKYKCHDIFIQLNPLVQQTQPGNGVHKVIFKNNIYVADGGLGAIRIQY